MSTFVLGPAPRPKGWIAFGGNIGEVGTIAMPVRNITSIGFGDGKHRVFYVTSGEEYSFLEIECSASALLNSIALAQEDNQNDL